MKKLLGQYVSKDIYEQLVANPELARLGGQRREMPPVPIGSIAAVADGSAGVAGSSSPTGGSGTDGGKEGEAAAAKKKGFGLSALKPTVTPEKSRSASRAFTTKSAMAVPCDQSAAGSVLDSSNCRVFVSRTCAVNGFSRSSTPGIRNPWTVRNSDA